MPDAAKLMNKVLEKENHSRSFIALKGNLSIFARPAFLSSGSSNEISEIGVNLYV